LDLKEKTSNPNRHPWELSRAQCILNLIRRKKLKCFVDIGAGDRFFAKKLLTIDSSTVYAVDSAYDDKTACINGVICLNHISKLPEKNFDSLILMDVLEHIKDDDVFLKEALDKLVANGVLFITVPAMQFLFSSHDRFLGHYRRYSRRRLLALLNKNDLEIEQCFYFYTGLFFFRLVSLIKDRLMPEKKQVGVGMWRFPEKYFITQCIVRFLNMDFFISSFFGKRRIYLPGLSLVAVCKKKRSKVICQTVTDDNRDDLKKFSK
jgi:SAM-dependent methyltransferase